MWVVALGLGSQASDTEKAGLASVLNYYFGRIDNAAPGADLQAALRREAKSMTAEQMRSLSQSCSAEVVARGQYLQQVGTAMQKAAR